MEKISNTEEEKPKRFVYRDNYNNHKIVFECLAPNITEADSKYQEETGNNPAQQIHVGCSIEEIEDEE